jgi:hypothetical protein
MPDLQADTKKESCIELSIVYFIACPMDIATKDSKSVLSIISILFPTFLGGTSVSSSVLLVMINREL